MNTLVRRATIALLVSVYSSGDLSLAVGLGTRDIPPSVSNPISVAHTSQESVLANEAASFVSDVTIPDGTSLSPLQSFIKTWKIRNTGSTNWRGYSLAFADGAPMGARSSVPVPATTPGATVDVSVPMTAPKEAGQYKSSWRMTTADGRAFGQEVFVLVVVVSPTEQGSAFHRWEAELADPSAAVRERALKESSRFGPKANPALIRIFRKETDERVRVLALSALGDNKPLTKEAIRVFLEATSDPSTLVRFTATMFIQQGLPSQISPEMVPTFIEELGNPSPARRQLAIQLIAYLGPEAREAASALKKLVTHDPDPEVRTMAREALTLIGAPGDMPDEK